MSTNTNSLYDTDYGLWLASQIDSIRSHRWEELDIDNLIEELEGLNRSNERELESYLVIILTHLLKWEYQPQARSGSWKGSIFNGRKRIARLFKQQPSLRPRVPEFLPEAYADSIEVARLETGLPADVFPAECSYSPSQILDIEFLPGDSELPD
ncbi:DUF29 domain-containing protein [Gloeocapsopsis dulcis]|uniref:DUF29 domain-containing protein n=1 Tax=Gloeocapsopsis dulcis AAB1 = 1H9 TaxID=1433147 RepID=A0A6N8FR55_9CHRO|nr:DUF29 domain-containing protein [Gloeocapsopsis dulcis]MUL34845.1 hypothetical protein [Gloeocapsopsis dulcis AAB1 = 1H9]WNN90087.1 DUF29 domain-containing protein [Gloeocapsopsis dulcis]